MTAPLQSQGSARKPSLTKTKLKGSGGSAGSFLGLPGFGSRDRGPPPALFTHPSPQASHVSIPGIHRTNSTTINPDVGSGAVAPTPTPAPASSLGAITKGPPTSTAPSTTKVTVKSTTAAREATITTVASSSNAAVPSPTNPRRTGTSSTTAPTAFVVPASIHRTPSISSIGSSAGALRSTASHTTRSADRTDALWAEMQATLEEVEFSATGSTHVFRAEHERKLADLRAAQIALAQAWARNESDDVMENSKAVAANGSADASGADGGASGAIDVDGTEVRNLRGDVLGGTAAPSTTDYGDGTNKGNSSAAPTGVSAGNTGSGSTVFPRPGSSGSGVGIQRMSRMEEETEVDILLAKKRRDANDRYFRRVNQGVIDVVSKLSDVAEAMRKVEAESKDIWSESESVMAAPVNAK